MQFDEPKVIDALEAWRWILPPVDRILAVSRMGNVFLSDTGQCHWRVCPEELSATRVASTPEELDAVYADPDFKADWQMAALVEEMVELQGDPEIGECFGLTIPGVLGGEYHAENIRRRSLYEYLQFTGDLAEHIKDLKDGDAVTFEIV